MKHLFELIPDVAGHDEQAHVFDPSAGGTGASARNHGENQQHPGESRPKVVIIRSKSTGRMSSSYLKQGFTERSLQIVVVIQEQGSGNEQSKNADRLQEPA